MTITVYEDRLEEIEKKLASFEKNAAKCNCEFTYKIGEAHPVKVSIHEYDFGNHAEFVSDTYMVSGVDIELGDDMIKNAGWTVIAKIEHFENGNLVTMFNGAETPENWRTCTSRCDHCGTNRRRAVTYMVQREESGVVRQVGSGCLKEYTGINPVLAVLWAAIRDYFGENEIVDCDAEHFNSSARLWDVRDVIAHAVDEVNKNGYKSVNQYGSFSTGSRVCERYTDYKVDPSKDGYKVADDIIDWMNTFDFEAVDEKIRYIYSFVRDLVPLTIQGWCKPSHVNRLAYLPVEWKKELERREKDAARAASREAEKASGFVGEIGQRIDIKVKSCDVLTSWETMYGTTFLVKIIDEDGNVFVWFSSTGIERPFAVKEIKATVKEHNEREGVKQTIITRAKVTARADKSA